MIEKKMGNIIPEEEFVLPNESPLLSVIKNYQRVKIQDPDKAKSQFSQVRKILMKDKEFQEYCKANDFYSDNPKFLTTEDPDDSSEITNLITPFKSILLSHSETPPSLTQQDSSSSLPTHSNPKSTREIPKSNLNSKKETLKPEKYPNNSQPPKTISKDISRPSHETLKPPLTAKPKSQPIKKKSSNSSEEEKSSSEVEVNYSKVKPSDRNYPLGGKKSYYRRNSSSYSSSSSLEESVPTDSHEDNDSDSQDSSSSSHKKSKKSTTTKLRTIQVPKENSSNKKKIKSPSQKILSLLNTADEYKLKDKLACIGPKRALQIVKYREKNGPYSSIGELTQLEGIGSKWVKSFIESNQDI